MRVFRISKTKRIRDVSGEGARLNGGRWNPKGMAVLYASSTLSLSSLEFFVHLDPADVGIGYASIALDLTGLSRTRLDTRSLPKNWREYPALTALQAFGADWLTKGATLILEVPSVVIPSESNFLLNPEHPEMSKVKLEAEQPFQFDPRM